MNREELALMQHIQKIFNNQDVLLKKPKSPQQQLLHIYAHRELLNKNIIHKLIDQAVAYLPGTFANTTLQLAYMSMCLQTKIQLTPNHYPVLKMLIDWSQAYSSFKSLDLINLTDIVVQGDEVVRLSNLQEYITYLDLIGQDIIKLVRRSNKEGPDKTQSNLQLQNHQFSHINPQDLLMFVNISLPNILIDVLLTNEVIPIDYQRQISTFECLYKDVSIEYFIRSKNNYGQVLKTLIQILLTIQFKPSLQILLMNVVFRYFYAFHHDKKYQSTQIFIEAYNRLNENARYALAQEFLIFFRISRKIGKNKFIDFVINNSQWFKQITTKVLQNKILSKTRDTISPFNSLGLAESITVEIGKKLTRTLQILEDYSLLYFRIQILTQDITIRFYYLGEIHSEQSINNMLIDKPKFSGQFSTNVMAVKRGLYCFQFDNSYSWISNKSLTFEKVLLVPIQMLSFDRYKWIETYYGNLASNQIVNKDKILFFKHSPVQSNQQFIGEADITKKDIYYNIKITKKDYEYEFQSQNQDKFLQKFHTLVETVGEVRWKIQGQPLQGLETVRNFIASRQAISKAKKAQKNSSIPKEKNNASASSKETSTLNIKKKQANQQ